MSMERFVTFPTPFFAPRAGARLVALVCTLLLVGAIAAPSARAADADGDGVDDSIDACPTEDASFFDADGDGCVDPTAHARQVEYWDPADLPLVYVVHENGAPGIGDGSDFAAIQAGFDAWSAVPGVALGATYGGTVAQANGDGTDGVNLVSFEDPDFVALFGNAVLAVGVSTSFEEPGTFQGNPVRPGQIVDADMLFNPNRTFTTDGLLTGVDLQAVATHEAGHVFGLNHSALPVATMFPALPSGIEARSLEVDDELLAFMSYPDATTLVSATSVAGTVVDGGSSAPIPGAIVFAIPAGATEAIATQYTLPDGSWRFDGLPNGDYEFFVHPLDGSAGANGVIPGFVNPLVVATAQTLFLPEYWSAAESAADDPLARDAVTLVGGAPVTGIDVITNVDATPPQVTGVSPATGVDDANADGVVLLQFDEPVDFDSLPSRFSLEKVEGSVRTGVAGQLVALGERDKVVFTPNTRLDFGTDYELTIDAGLLDRFGNATSAPFVTNFSTEPKPPLEIVSIQPEILVSGTLALISGKAFDETAPGANVVSFGGVEVPATSANYNQLAVIVPEGLPLGTLDVGVRTAVEVAPTTLPVRITQVSDVARGAPSGEVALQGLPRSVTVLPDATWTLSATSFGLEAVLVDGGSGDFGLLRSAPLTGGLEDVAVVPGGRRAYGVSRASGLLRAIDTDDGGDPENPLPSFLQPLADLPTGAEPLGVAIGPAGRRAYVATVGGAIQKWDLELGSPTFHQQVGEIDTGRAGLRGALALDRTGERLLALAPGELLVYGAATDSNLATVAIGPDARDVTVGPQGTQAYVTHVSGDISVVSLQSYALVQTIAGDGEFRGVSLSPTGGLGYAADRRDEQVAVFDLREGEASFRTLVADLDVQEDPVDLVVAPDGLRVFSVHEAGASLQILGIGFGPTLGNPFPWYARPGDIVAFGGSGFAPTDSASSIVTSTSALDFDGEVVGFGGPMGATTNAIWGRIPAGFDGGPVRALVSGAVAVGVPDVQASNPSFVRLFDQEEIDRTRGVIALARTFGNDGEFPWQDQPINTSATLHPRGDFLLVEVGNVVYAVGMDESSGQYLGNLGSFDASDGRYGVERKFTPDGERLYTRSGNIISYLDMDVGSPTFGDVLGTVDFSSIESQGYIDTNGDVGAFAIAPDGSFLAVWVGLVGTVYTVPLEGAQANRATLSTATTVNRPRRLLFHPSGEWLYSVDQQGTNISVLSYDSDRADYLQETATIFGWEGSIIEDAAVSPDGSLLFSTQRNGGLGGAWEFVVHDLTDPSAPAFEDFQTLEATGPTSATTLALHPNGLRAAVVIPERRIAYIDLAPSYVPDQLIGDGLFEPITDVTGLGLFSNEVTWAADGKRLVVAEQTNTVFELYDFASFGAPGVAVVSGADQTAVAGETLPAPVRIRATDEAGNGVPDLLLDVSVQSGGGTLDGGATERTYETDDEGFVEVEWTLGPTPDPSPGTPTNVLAIRRSLANILVEANATVEPTSVPLELVQVLPLDGTGDVGVTTSVQAVFSRPVDRASVLAGAVVLREAVSGALVPSVIAFADQDRRVTVLPLGPLDYASDYTFEVGAAVADLDANTLGATTTVGFGTVAAPSPSLDSLSPPAATVGTQITIAGSGFDPVAANNAVDFGAQTLTPVEAGVDFLRFVVPPAAVSSPVSVTVGGETTASVPFTVLVPVTDPIDEITEQVDLGLVTSALAVLPDGSKGYSVSPTTDQVIPLDLQFLQPQDPIEVGDQPVAAVAEPTGLRVYVANFGDATLSVIDTATDVVEATIALPAAPTDLVVSPEGDRVFAITPADSSVHVVDGDTSSATFNTVVTSINTGRGISKAAVSPDGTRLYIGTDDGFLIVGLSSTDFGVVTSINTGRGISKAAVSPDGGLLILITDNDEIQVVDVSPGSDFGVVTSLSTGRGIAKAAVSPDGGLLYLLEEETDEVVVVAIEVQGTVSATEGVLIPLVVTLTEIARFEGGDDPEWIAFDPIDPRVSFVGASGDRAVSVFGRASTVPATLEMVTFDADFDANARYVCARVDFPAPYDVRDVDPASIRLVGTAADGTTGAPIGAVPDPAVRFEDPDGDGRFTMIACFNREDFQREIPMGEAVELCITGDAGGTPFEGCETIQNLCPEITYPTEGEMLVGGQDVTVTWETPPGLFVDYVELWFSATNGIGPLFRQGGALPDTGSYKWTVPEIPTSRARLFLVAYSDKKVVICGTVTPIFGIDTQPVAVAVQGVTAEAENGDGVLRWSTGLARGLAGFRVLRAADDGAYTEVGYVGAEQAPLRDGAHAFHFVDTGVVANVDYRYLLEESYPDRPVGEGFRHGPFELRFSVSNALEQNVPNSFNPRTSIRFSVAQEARTRLVVYDLRGRVVRVLVDEVLRPDVYTRVWDGTDDRGARVSSGVYLYRLETEGFTAARKMTLLR